jgi:uroporphyrinogen-III synthase|tara:strand:- start:62 stop:715 length:654 start_codon:yes stop_codon:yes gene_type:complete
MNIIDTRSNINLTNYQKNSVRNIPLFQIKGIRYSLKSKDYTDIIFQSIPSVKFFNDYEFLRNKNIYSMGVSTQNFLSQEGIISICPKVPGSEGLNKLLSKNKNNRKYLVVKGEDGLSNVFDYLSENGKDVQELICYKRLKLDSYEDIKKDFYKADAIIFSSTYAVEVFFHEIFSGEMNATFFGISNRIIKFISDFGYEAKFIDYFSENISESIKKSI